VKRLHVVDGTYELYRAHFGRRPGHEGPDGRDLKATVGIVASLFALLDDRDEAVTHLAVAFDNPIRSFRNDLFAGYKSDEGVPPELRAQFDAAEDAVRALGVTVWSMCEWEADDAMATAAARFASADCQVRLLTPDKDLGQCLVGSQVVQIDRMRGKTIDEAAFRERWGIDPENLPDYLALVGDSADGIPGISGFGEKGAASIIARYRTLEQIPALARDWDVAIRGAARLAEELSASLGTALLYRKLATLVSNVDLGRSEPDDLHYRGAVRGDWQAWCDDVGVPQWKERPKFREG